MGEIVQLKKTRIPRARDAFYQAIPVNEIQGRYFHFGRNKIPIELLAEREREKADSLFEGLPDDRNFEIIHDPTYGVPGALAYRIWTGIEKMLSDFGSTFDGRLKLSTRQIAKIAGRSYSGQASKEISQAIKQLSRSEITYWYDHPELKNEDGTPEVHQETFSLIDKVSFVRDQRKSAPHYYIITVPEIILGFLFHDRYFFCMSWDRVKELPPQSQSVARILYRYMSYRYSKANSVNFLYTKDYATMCEQWLGGVKPLDTKSRLLQKHLAPRLDPIIATGLLSSYEAKRNKAKDGFNILFTPGEEFFADFASFYKKQLPLNFGSYKSERDPHLGHPETNLEDGAFALLAHFHEHWFGADAERDYLNAEIEFAQQILSQVTLSDAKVFVTWAITRAHETKFKMQTFNALKTYFSTWKSERKKEADRLHKMEAVRAKEMEALDERRYEDFVQARAQEIIDGLSQNDRDDLAKNARAQLQLQFPNEKKFLSGHLLSVERRLITDTHDIPTFDDWKALQA
ncbi:hypothetical protein ACUNV4_29485 [Granulosicoccus sp. 3-233]|uniref:hypothetical protein n=1 Tax=Granulosicoccus sp. 3-233 TaxID=3417969 RepID=UPI003D3476F2